MSNKFRKTPALLLVILSVLNRHPNAQASEWPGTPSRFNDYRWDSYTVPASFTNEQYTFTTNGLNCKVLVPSAAAEGKPWVLRARFWGAFPGADIALVSNGFHVAYVDVADEYGSPTAVARFNAFYDFMVNEHEMDKRVVLEGMSRGGLPIYNWARDNVGKVHCAYADAPVCDFKSWPMGQPSFASDWVKCKAAYGFTSDAEAIAYEGNPVDNMQPMADAMIPLIHVVGDDDTIVPVSENTAIIETHYLTNGAPITVIHKPGVGHIHGLSDWTPVVNFILTNRTDLYNQPATDVLFESATCNSTLSLPGTNYNIRFHWGTTGGGTNTSAWTHTTSNGLWETGNPSNYSYVLFNLDENTTYYYAFSATNETEVIWDRVSASFTTLSREHIPVFESGTSVSNGQFNVQFSGTTGEHYRVEYTSALTNEANEWQTITDVVSLVSSPMEISATATNNVEFYRVLWIP